MLEIFWLLPLATLFQEGECSEKKWLRRNKKGQVPKTSKKRKKKKKEKVRREVKMDKCPIAELGVQDTHLREKKNKI